MDDCDKAYLVELFFVTGSATAAVRKYSHQKGIKSRTNMPSEAYVRALVAKFRERGTVESCYPKDKMKNFDMEHLKGTVSEVVDEIKNNSGIPSVRKIAAHGDVPCSSTTVWKIMRNEMNWKAWKSTRVQHLPDHCFEKWLNFCKWFLSCSSDYTDRILFTDESNFYTQGFVNKQNVRFWGLERPDESVMSRSLHSPKLTVWCGFSAKFSLKLYFFPINSNVTSESYQNMIKEYMVN